MQIVPDKGGYTPIWDVAPVVWTQAAIDAGKRVRVTDEGDIANLFSRDCSPAPLPARRTAA